MAVLPPIVLPPEVRNPRGRNRHMYTLHLGPNTIYATRPTQEEVSVSVVAFTKRIDAKTMGLMLEENKRRTKEWPSLMAADVIMLPVPNKSVELSFCTIHSWKQSDLEVYCTAHFLDMILVTEMNSNEHGYSVMGDLYKLTRSFDYYRERLGELFSL